MTVQLCRVDFEPVGKRVEVLAGGTLLDAAHAAGIELASVCGGHGHCGRCRLTVLSGDIGGPAEADHSFLSQPELDDGQRLACQSHIAGGVRVHVPRASLVTSQRLQIGGLAGDVAVEAEVRGWLAEAMAPTLSDHRSDFDRVAQSLRTAHGPSALGGLTAEPAVLR